MGNNHGKWSFRGRSLILLCVLAFGGISTISTAIVVIKLFSGDIENISFEAPVFSLMTFMVGVWAVLNVYNLIEKKDVDALIDAVKATEDKVNKLGGPTKQIDITIKASATYAFQELLIGFQIENKQVSVPYVTERISQLNHLIDDDAPNAGILFRKISNVEFNFRKTINAYKLKSNQLQNSAEIGGKQSYALKEFVDSLAAIRDDEKSFLRWYADFRRLDMQWYANYKASTNSEDDIAFIDNLVELITEFSKINGGKAGSSFDAIYDYLIHLEITEAGSQAKCYLYLFNLVAEYINRKLLYFDQQSQEKYNTKRGHAFEIVIHLCESIKEQDEFKKACSEMYRNYGVYLEQQQIDRAENKLTEVENYYRTALQLDPTNELNYQVLVSLNVKQVENIFNTGKKDILPYDVAADTMILNDENRITADNCIQNCKTLCDIANSICPLSKTLISINMRTYNAAALLYGDKPEAQRKALSVSQSFYNKAIALYGDSTKDSKQIVDGLKYECENFHSFNYQDNTL